MNRYKIFLCACPLAALFCAFPPRVLADAGVDNTQGPGSYQDSVLSLDANITKEVNFTLGYEQAASSSAISPDLTKTYTGGLNIKSGEHYTIGLSLSNSPEANNAKSTGWGASVSYSSEKQAVVEDNPGDGLTKTSEEILEKDSGTAKKDEGTKIFTWGCSLAYNAADLSELIDYNTLQKRLAKNGKAKLVTVDHSDWYALRQTHADPGLTCELFELVDLTLGYSKYSYDKDVSVFSQQLAKLAGTKGVRNGNFGSTTSLIDGFPDTIFSAGVSVSPLDSLKLEFDWSRTSYVLDQPQEDSSTFTVFYNLLPALQLKAGYNVLSTQAVYILTGIKWIW